MKSKPMKSPKVGHPIADTTFDNGCGSHDSKSEKRKKTRKTKKEDAIKFSVDNG